MRAGPWANSNELEAARFLTHGGARWPHPGRAGGGQVALPVAVLWSTGG